MKKLLLVLMVIAMASFLFVGCLGVTPEPEPEPEPGPGTELQLTGIAVLPKTMDLIVGESEVIKSVTATYEVKGYDVEVIDSEDCLFLTSDKDVATVLDGKVTAKGAGTANILVSYEGKIDTLVVKVTYLPMEITADLPLFTTGTAQVFTIDTVANSDKGEIVKAYFTLPAVGIENLWYWEVSDGSWQGPLTDTVVFGPDTGFSLVDITTYFKANFNTAGTYKITVEWRTYPGDVLLCKKIITAVVVPAID